MQFRTWFGGSQEKYSRVQSFDSDDENNAPKESHTNRCCNLLTERRFFYLLLFFIIIAPYVYILLPYFIKSGQGINPSSISTFKIFHQDGNCSCEEFVTPAPIEPPYRIEPSTLSVVSLDPPSEMMLPPDSLSQEQSSNFQPADLKLQSEPNESDLQRSFEQVKKDAKKLVFSRMKYILRNKKQIDAVRLYHLHIPKTSGTSLDADFKTRNLSIRGSETQWNSVKPSELLLISMVREPVSHVVSMYQHCLNSQWSKKRFCRQMAFAYDRLPFQNWIHHFAHMKRTFNTSIERALYEEYGKKHDLMDFTVHNDDSRGRYQPFACFTPINVQSNRMGITDADDEQAIKDRIFRDWFHIGLKEYYFESLCVLLVKIYKSVPESCKQGSCDENVIRFSHGVKAYDYKEILSTANDEDIAEITSIDQIVYEYSILKLKFEVMYIRQHFDSSFLCKKYANG